MDTREDIMTNKRSGAPTLNGLPTESENQFNVTQASHRRKIKLLIVQLHCDSHHAPLIGAQPTLLKTSKTRKQRIAEILTECRVSTAAAAEAEVRVCVHGKAVRHLTVVHSPVSYH